MKNNIAIDIVFYKVDGTILSVYRIEINRVQNIFEVLTKVDGKDVRIAAGKSPAEALDSFNSFYQSTINNPNYDK